MENNPLIIAGSGRSGTTWVLDVLAEANNLRPVFEPLNPEFVYEARNICNRYLTETENEPELKHFLEKVFMAQYQNLWVDLRCNKANLIPSVSQITSWDYFYDFASFYKLIFKRSLKYIREKSFIPITKFIRANLMLDWLEDNFKPRIIFLVRHPGAVAASKIAASKTKGGAAWDFNSPNEQRVLSQYRQDEKLRKDYLNKYNEIFSEKLSPIAGYTLLWCIENILPIYNQQKKKRYVFFYEDIVINPDREFDRMVKILGLHRNPEKSIFLKPSKQASQEFMNTSSMENQLTRWMKMFNQQELDEIDKILSFFKVTTYNAYEPMPVSRVQNSL